MYAHDNGLDFWIVNEIAFRLLLRRICCQLLHLKHMWNVCSQSVESWQQLARQTG